MKKKELALKLKNIVFDNEQRHNDIIDFDELLKDFEQALNMCAVLKPLKYKEAMTFYDWSIHSNCVQVDGGYRIENKYFTIPEIVNKYNSYYNNL
jgi:hypothetical protein